jgi:hypothetical protein
MQDPNPKKTENRKKYSPKAASTKAKRNRSKSANRREAKEDSDVPLK